MMQTEYEIWGKIFKAKEEVVHRDIAGEALLVPVRGKLADMQKIFSLNPVAEFIWKRLNGNYKVEDIRNDILTTFDVPKEQADSDIEDFIGELLREGLIFGEK
jgi:hypothetical protein